MTILEQIAEKQFLFVVRGENYSAELVKGKQLLDMILEAVFGNGGEFPKERADYSDDLNNEDHWCLDQHFGPYHWTESLEDGTIEILLVTA